MSKQWDSPKRTDQSASCFFCLSFQYKYSEVLLTMYSCKKSLVVFFFCCVFCFVFFLQKNGSYPKKIRNLNLPYANSSLH